MRKLYHYPICPLSRQVRIILKELNLTFSLIKEDYWLARPEFLKTNPGGVLPVLEENPQLIIPGIYPIVEYLYEQYPNLRLMSGEISAKTEIRKLFWLFNDKFYKDVTQVLIDEKIIRLTIGHGMPRPEFIRAARANLLKYLNYLSDLLETHSFIACDNITVADIAAGCHISVLDYFGEINWENFPLIHSWYAILKSRPSFRPILQDRVPGFTPSGSYADLDF